MSSGIILIRTKPLAVFLARIIGEPNSTFYVRSDDTAVLIVVIAEHTFLAIKPVTYYATFAKVVHSKVLSRGFRSTEEVNHLLRTYFGDI